MLFKIGRVIGLCGGVCGLIATVAIFILPLYEGVSIRVTSSGARTEEHFRKTLLEAQSLEPITISFFSAVVALSLAAIFGAARTNSRRHGIAMLAAGVLLLSASLVSGFSVGAFYFPGALAVFVAGIFSSITSQGGPDGSPIERRE